MANSPNHENMDAGLKLFNQGCFFDAHEVLEDVWRTVPRDKALRLHLQGIVQLAVAFHHQSTGNHLGARSVLERALRNLAGADNSFPEFDLERLFAELEVWRRYLDLQNESGAARSGRPDVAPPLPRILRRG